MHESRRMQICEDRAGMKVATWNVNGIRARAAQLQEFIEREQPDVLCLRELKAWARIYAIVLRHDSNRARKTRSIHRGRRPATHARTRRGARARAPHRRLRD